MDRPILFQPWKVKKILNWDWSQGNMQTRRVFKLQSKKLKQAGYPIQPSKYGVPGDRLWVKETWRIAGWHPENGDWIIEYGDGAKRSIESLEDMDQDDEERYWTQCTDDCQNANIPEDDAGEFHFDEQHPCPTRWRPSIFMPRWASRITLEIVNVRVERLDQISLDDINAEGISWQMTDEDGSEMYEAYADLWDSINAKKGFGWDSNPYVWVIEFKLIKT